MEEEIYDESLIIDEDNGYSWHSCGYVSSKDHLLPERVQYKGYFCEADESEFDLAWYVREDLKDADRALTLQMLAVVLLDNGFDVGWKEDVHNTDSAILVMNLPQGWVCYRIPLSWKIAKLPDFEGEPFWVNTDYEQRDRMKTFIETYSNEQSV